MFIWRIIGEPLRLLLVPLLFSSQSTLSFPVQILLITFSTFSIITLISLIYSTIKRQTGVSPVAEKKPKMPAETRLLAKKVAGLLRGGLEGFSRPLPDKGESQGEILQKINQLRSVEKGEIHLGGMDLRAMAEKIRENCARFLYANPLHFDVVPGSLLLENELISMAINAFSGEGLRGPCKESGASGVEALGGVCPVGIVTQSLEESAIMGLTSFRENSRKRGIANPSVIIYSDVPPIFHKAAYRVNMKTIQVSSISELNSSISDSTACIVVSCISPIYGEQTPIESIASTLRTRSVNAGIFLYRGWESGVQNPTFGFKTPEVWAIAWVPLPLIISPGSSGVLLYKGSDMAKGSIFVTSKWNGGVYATPSVPGSRSGASSAFLSAVVCLIGREGLEALVSRSRQVARIIAELLRQKGWEIYKEPEGNVLVFKGGKATLLRRALKKKGIDLQLISPGGWLRLEVRIEKSEEIHRDFTEAINADSHTADVDDHIENWYLNGIEIEGNEAGGHLAEFAKEVIVQLHQC